MQNKQRLKEDLLNGLKRNKAIEQKNTKYKRYEVKMKLGVNKKIKVITIWQIDNKKPKFITAFPEERIK